MDVTVTFKPGLELTQEEIQTLDAAHLREWKLPPLDPNHLASHIFALAMKNSEIVAQGQFNILDNVQFAGETFSLWEVGGIISNDKGKGYGKILLKAMIEYLVKNKKTGIGFAGNWVKDFYQKGGFSIDESSLGQFENYQELSGGDEDYVFYKESEDKFMRKVQSNRSEKVKLF